MAIEQKGWEGYLSEDPSLSETFTYDEFYHQKQAAPAGEDTTVEQAVTVCMEMCERLERGDFV